jgi:hypothetical protein
LIKAEAEWREEMRTLEAIRVPAVVGYVIDWRTLYCFYP